MDEEGSDLDILAELAPEATLFDIGAMRPELRRLLGVRVDVMMLGALPDRICAAVLGEARAI